MQKQSHESLPSRTFCILGDTRHVTAFVACTCVVSCDKKVNPLDWQAMLTTCMLWMTAAASCLVVANSHSHDSHSCIHDTVIEHAEHERAAERVLLLQDSGEAADAASITAINITRRELEAHPAFTAAQNEHHRRLQSNTASYLARPWGGLRIHVEYVDVDGPGRDPAMTQAKADLLKNQILPGVVAKLRSVLQVSLASPFRFFKGTTEQCNDC